MNNPVSFLMMHMLPTLSMQIGQISIPMLSKDVLPPDMPEPQGRPVQITMFLNASHAANLVTCQSPTGVLIYCNMSLIIWHSKNKQNSIETSTFGSEFMALKTGIDNM